jgi:hypothetical protein
VQAGIVSSTNVGGTTEFACKAMKMTLPFCHIQNITHNRSNISM